MEYFVYKTEEEKEAIEKTIVDARKFVYHDDKLDYVKGVLLAIPFSNIENDKKIVQRLDLYYDGVFDNGTDRYYRCYDLTDSIKYQYIKAIMDYIIYNNSGGYNAPYITILNDYVHNTLEYQFENRRGNLTVFGEIGHLGLLAFSNELDVNVDNDLIRATLYNRNFLKERYEEIIGEGSFDELDKLCFDVGLSGFDTGIAYSKGVKDVINLLKEYFYKRLETLDIPNEDKVIMKSRFDLSYSNIIAMQNESFSKIFKQKKED